MDVDGGRSRVVGALLWSGFGATALLVVLATFVVALGDDEPLSTTTYPIDERNVDVPPSLTAAPLAVDERGASGDALGPIVDAHLDALGLVPRGVWQIVEPGAALPSADDACALVAIIAPEPGLSIDQPHTVSAGRVSFTAACPAAPSNGSMSVRARAFLVPDVTTTEVATAGVPPLVYITHVLAERDARFTPYSPGDGLVRLALSAAGFSPPGATRCVAWIGVITHAGGLVEPGLHVSVSCHVYTHLPVSTTAGDEIWMRPFTRKVGPHAERANVPSNAPRRPMRVTTVNDVLGTLAAAP